MFIRNRIQQYNIASEEVKWANEKPIRQKIKNRSNKHSIFYILSLQSAPNTNIQIFICLEHQKNWQLKWMASTSKNFLIGTIVQTNTITRPCTNYNSHLIATTFLRKLPPSTLNRTHSRLTWTAHIKVWNMILVFIISLWHLPDLWYAIQTRN